MDEKVEKEILLRLLMRRRRKRRSEKVQKRAKHRFWVRSVLKRREEYRSLTQELRNDDRESFFQVGQHVLLSFCHTDM